MNNDFIHSTKHNLGFDLYITDNNGRHKITTLSYSYDSQIIGEKLFYFGNVLLSGFEFFEYDLKTKKRRKIATLNAERIYNYYFLNDALYIEICNFCEIDEIQSVPL